MKKNFEAQHIEIQSYDLLCVCWQYWCVQGMVLRLSCCSRNVEITFDSFCCSHPILTNYELLHCHRFNLTCFTQAITKYSQPVYLGLNASSLDIFPNCSHCDSSTCTGFHFIPPNSLKPFNRFLIVFKTKTIFSNGLQDNFFP